MPKTKTKDGDLFLASNVDVVRGKKKNDRGQEVPNVEQIAAGQMVSDTDLKADEIKDLKARGVLRFPSKAERDAIDAAVDAAEAAETAQAEAAQKEIDDQHAAADAAAKEAKGKK